MVLIPTVNLALKNDSIRETIIRLIGDSLAGTLRSGELSISLDRKQLSISGKQVQGKLLHGALEFIIPSGNLTLRYTDLLRGSIFPDVVTADAPILIYNPVRDTSFSRSKRDDWGTGINRRLEKIFGRNTKLRITGAEITLAGTRLHGLSLSSTRNNDQTVVDLSTTIEYRQSMVPVKITGTATDPFAAPFSYDFTFNFDKLPLNLLPGSVDFFFSGGNVDFSGRIQGQRGVVRLSGKGAISNLDMSVGWTSDDKTIHQEKKYRIETIVLELQGALAKRAVTFSTIDLKADDFHILGSLGYDMTNPQDPLLDVRIRTKEMQLSTLKMLLPDPLINDWTTQTIFPRLQNGTARIDSLVLSGRLSEIAGLDTPEHADSLSWSGILRNVNTFYNDHQPLAQVHTTRLSMDGDVLKIEEMEAESGKSHLNRGDVTLAGLYDPGIRLTADLEGSFASSWLIKMAKAGLTGNEMKQFALKSPDVTGQMQGKLKISVDINDSIDLRSLSGSGTAGPLNIISKKTILPLQVKTSTFNLQYPGTSTIKAAGSWGKSPFTGTVNLHDLDQKENVSLYLQANLPELKKVFTDNPVIESLAPCMGTVPVSTEISLEKSIVNIQGKIDFSKAVKADDSLLCSQVFAANSLKQAEYRLKLQGNTLQVRKIRLLTTGKGSLTGSVLFRKKRKKPYSLENIRLKADDFPMQAARILLTEHSKWLSGTLTADIKTEDPAAVTDIFKSMKGMCRLQDWHGKLDYPDLTFTNVDIEGTMDRGKLTLAGNNITLKDFTLDNPIRLQAEFEKGEKWNGTVRIHADSVDMTSIPSLFRHGKTKVSFNLPVDGITILAGADHAWYNNIVFSPMYLHAEIAANRIYIAQGVIRLNESFIWLSGEADKENRAITYESYFKISGQPFGTILDMFGFENRRITGMLDLEGKFFSRVQPDETVFEKAVGGVYFESKEGMIRSSSTLMKILDLISLENIFDKKDVLQWKDSFKYNLIQGRFDLSDGVFTTKSVIMDAPVLDIFAEGSVDVANDKMDMIVKLAPFGTISKILSSIPFIGYVVTGKTKSLFDYTLSVKGKLDNPEVRYIPLAGTLESLGGYIKRLVTSREDIQKKVNSKVTENMARQRQFIRFMKKELSALYQDTVIVN